MRFVVAIGIGLILLLSACAENDGRFLTKDEDDAIRAKCQDGCAVMPNDVYQHLLELLKQRSI